MRGIAKLIVIGAIALLGCGDGVFGPGELATLEVSPVLAECVGVGPQQCLQIRKPSQTSWSLLYDGIEGFRHDPDYLVTIRVRIVAVANPPADASSQRYYLVKVLRRVRVLQLH